jgi:holliday junction DNA helicase RuvA
LSYIAWLSGKVVSLAVPDLVLNVQGVGYALSVPERFSRMGLHAGADCTVFVHTVVREDDLLLFGFMTASERDLFRVLLKVSGIGPKMALAFISSFSVSELLHAIAQRQIKLLTSVKGVGLKAAERLLLEVQPQLKRLMPALLGEVSEAEVMAMSSVEERMHPVYDALLKLGYQPNQAKRALKSVPSDVQEEERALKTCLQFLSGVS